MVESVEKKRSSLSKDSSSPPKKKKQQSVIDVDLPNAPVDGECACVSPTLLNVYTSLLPCAF